MVEEDSGATKGFFYGVSLGAFADSIFAGGYTIIGFEASSGFVNFSYGAGTVFLTAEGGILSAITIGFIGPSVLAKASFFCLSSSLAFATISLLTIACPSAFEASSLAFIALDFASAFDSSLPPDFSTASASAAAFKAASAFSYATAFAAVSALIASLVFAAASSATILFASVTASIFTAISFF